MKVQNFRVPESCIIKKGHEYKRNKTKKNCKKMLYSLEVVLEKKSECVNDEMETPLLNES